MPRLSLLLLSILIVMPRIASPALAKPSSIDTVAMVVEEAIWAADNCPQYELNEPGVARYLMAHGLNARELQRVVRHGVSVRLSSALLRELAASENWRKSHMTEACQFAGRLADPSAGSAVLLRRGSSD